MATATKTRNTITLKGSAQIVSEFFGYAVNSILYQRGVYPQESFQPRKHYGLSMMVTRDDALTRYLATVSKQMTEWLSRGELERLVLIVASAATRETLERWTFEVETCVDVRAQRAAERAPAGAAAGGGARLLGGAGAPAQGKAAAAPLPEKPEREITAEIQAIIRQITASVTFLPLLEEPCTFDLLVYTKRASALGGAGGGAGGAAGEEGADGEAAGEEDAAAAAAGGLVPIPSDWEESDPRYVAPGCAADVRLRSFSTKVHKVDTAVTYRASDD